MYNHIDRVINFALQYCIYPPAYPLEIGKIILRIYPEQNLLTSAILYSTIDHSSQKNISKGLKQIKDYFGANTAHKISNITKFSNYEYIAHDLTQIRKFTNALNLVDKTTNLSILLIKIAILLHSISVFNNYYDLSREQIKLTSLEILEVYLPLISWIDIKDVKTELQEFCTKILYPNINEDIKKYLGTIESSKEFLNNIVEDLNKELSNSQIKATVSGRMKSYYSIWRKLHYKNTTIEKLNDIIGFRIIVDNIDDCYYALKVIHKRYQYLPERFHDFIRIPKGNGYQSLHTVIVGPQSQNMEIQIRTTEMHQVAQHGSAAHWQYKHDFTKTLSVFIAAQKLYTKPTVNLATPNSITQHNTSNINIPIIANNILHNTPTIHIGAIGLLAAYSNKQSTDNEVATDENQYITSLQTEYSNSCAAFLLLTYGCMDLLFKFVQDNVYNQIIDFIVINDVANLMNISVEDTEYKAQEFWRDISYVNDKGNITRNQQNKNSKHISSSKKEVIVTSSNSYVHRNHSPILVAKNSIVTENIARVKTNALTKIQSNSNGLNSEPVIQEEKQEINPTQNIFNTTLQVSNTNISDNTTNITKFYIEEFELQDTCKLQDNSAKNTNDDVQCFQLDPLNTTTVSKVEEDNPRRFKRSSIDESDVVVDSDNKITNTANKTPGSNSLCSSEAPINIHNIAAAHAENKSNNSTNITKEYIIKLHRYAAKIFCAIIESEGCRKQLEYVIKNDFHVSVKKVLEFIEYPSNRKNCPISKQIYNLFNSYESICPKNIDSIFDSVDVTSLENTEQNISLINKLIEYNTCQGPQIITGNAVTRYFIRTLQLSNNPAINIDQLITLYTLYCESTNYQNILHSDPIKEIAISDNIYWNSIKNTMFLYINWNYKAYIESNQENKDSKLINLTHKPSDNEINTDQNTKIMEYVKSGNLIEVCNILFGCLGGANYLAQDERNNCDLKLMLDTVIKIINSYKQRTLEIIDQVRKLQDNQLVMKNQLSNIKDVVVKVNQELQVLHKTKVDQEYTAKVACIVAVLDKELQVLHETIFDQEHIIDKIVKIIYFLDDELRETKVFQEHTADKIAKIIDLNEELHKIRVAQKNIAVQMPPIVTVIDKELKVLRETIFAQDHTADKIANIINCLDTELEILIDYNQRNDTAVTTLLNDVMQYSNIQYSNKCAVENILNIKDEDGNTPILIAIRKGNFPMTMLLLNFRGSDLNVENENHDTPLSLAFTSPIINRCIINILMQEIIIKYEEQLSIVNKKFIEFVTSSKEFKQFYNACRSYVENFSSIMIIDLLVKMSIVSPELMQNLVVGLYYKSYIEGDCEFREYLKCIGCVDTDTAKEDCNMMMSNDYNQAIESQSTANSTVPERYGVTDIKKLLKCFYELQQSGKQLLIICKMMTQHFQHLKIEDKKGIDMEGMLTRWKCQSDADRDAVLTTLSTICKYVVKTAIMMRIEYNSMSCKTDETQESHSNQDLIKCYEALDKDWLEESRKIVEVMTRPAQSYASNDDDEGITKDATALHMLCTELLKVYSLANTLMNDKNISTEYLTEKYEEMLKSTHRVKELFYDIYSYTTLDQKDLSLFDRKALPAPSDTKILPEYSVIEFLRKDPIIKAEDRKSIMKEVREAIAKDVDDIQQMEDILSYVTHAIGLEIENADTILTGEQQDLE